MNCPQCQTPNQPDAAFCANCGAQLAAAGATAPPGGYAPPPGPGNPAGYAGSDAVGYGAPSGYGQAGPASQYPSAPPPAEYPPAGGQYQPRQSSSFGQFHFDLKRLTRVDQIIGVATLVVMISLFLDWVTGTVTATLAGASQSQSASETGVSEHGWLWLVFVLGLLLLAYLVMRAGWDEPPVKLPVAHAPLLLVVTGVNFLLVLIGFFLTPTAPSTADLQSLGVTGSASVSWDIGAYLALIAAIAAFAPVAWPVIQSRLAANRG